MRVLFFILLLAAQVIWFTSPRSGSVTRLGYRSRERLEAFKEHSEHPSAATEAKLQHELSLADRYEDRRRIAIFVAFLAFDALLLICDRWWRRGKNAAKRLGAAGA